jgi:hypothetical protein
MEEEVISDPQQQSQFSSWQKIVFTCSPGIASFTTTS